MSGSGAACMPPTVQARSLGSGFAVDAPSTSAPIGNPLFDAVGFEAFLAEELDGFDGHDAVRATTIGGHLTVLGQLFQAGLEIGERNRYGPGNVSRAVLLGGAHVEHCHLTGPHAAEQLFSGHRLHRSVLLEV